MTPAEIRALDRLPYPELPSIAVLFSPEILAQWLEGRLDFSNAELVDVKDYGEVLHDQWGRHHKVVELVMRTKQP